MVALRDRVTAAYKAFREPNLVTAPAGSDEWDDFEARQLRYAIYWAFFENTAYRSMHSWSHAYKVQHGLYRYIRNIYNPAHRLGVFWQTYLMGGLLDPEAGDGSGEPSALPIVTDNERLRDAIALLWRHSRWQTNKDVFTLQGSVFGDVALEVVDDTERGLVYLRVVNPSTVQEIELDPFGSVKGYVLQESRPDPTGKNASVTYVEQASRSGDNVVYRTYMNGQPWAWNGTEAEWAEPYGFIPMVLVKHNDVGLDWGWSEMHPGRGKFQEVDDLASKLSDQIRKMVDAPWLFAGVDKPSSTRTATSRDSETYQETSSATNRPQPGREELPALYGPEGATATPLVAPLDISATVAYLDTLLKELERDYPELQMDIWSTTGDASGRALRVARQRTEAKVLQRRAAYDDALVRAQQMAVAIGGWREYEGYRGFGLDSYRKGELDHNIDKRPVFALDPMDDIEIDTATWTAAKEAVAAGIPIEFYLEHKGWDPAKLRRLGAAMEAQSEKWSESGPSFPLAAEERAAGQEMADDGEE